MYGDTFVDSMVILDEEQEEGSQEEEEEHDDEQDEGQDVCHFVLTSQIPVFRSVMVGVASVSWWVWHQCRGGCGISVIVYISPD